MGNDIFSSDTSSFLDIDLGEIEGLLAEPDNEPLELLAKETVERRLRIAGIWNEFWKTTKRDPDQIWLDLCQPGATQERAIHFCRTFLQVYAERRKRRRVSLDPEEYKISRTVNSAVSLLTTWRSLVLHFNQTLLARKRREDPHNKAQWCLKIDSGLHVDKAQGPVYEVTKWIRARAEKLQLRRDQTFVKREATAEDIALLIKTLWERAADIPCEPQARIGFHNMLLLSGIGGFRPGVLFDIKYHQVALELVLHPSTGEKQLIATFTLKQNKQQASAIKFDQSNILSISIIFVRSNFFCPVSLVVARALADSAFDPPVDSFQALLTRPLLEGNQRLRFEWKKDLRDAPIFPLNDHTFSAIWLRTTLVAGYPERVRPYSMRVGAGNRLDGALSSSLRNYIMSHTSRIFEKSYQTKHVRADLMAAFAPGEGNDQELHDLLRRSSLDCDPKAPIYVKRSDIAHWEDTRQDLKECAITRDFTRRSSIIKALSRELLAKRREAYFQDAARLKATGQSTDSIAVPHQNPERVSVYAGELANWAALVAESLDTRAASPTDTGRTRYIERLVAYQLPSLAVRQSSVRRHPSREREEAVMERLSVSLRCLLCQLLLKDRDNLNKHYRNMHKSDFNEPSPCPECPKDEAAVVSSWKEWIAHVEACHGLENAPTRTFDASVKRRCLLCDKSFETTPGLSNHVARIHHGDFEQPFPCPACRKQKLDECMISSMSEWCSHLAVSHTATPAPALPATCKHRCLVCLAEVVNERGHYDRHHLPLFEKPLRCPECARQGISEVPSLSGLDEWQLHCVVSHGRTTTVYGTRALRRCLFCDERFTKVSDHFTKRHTHAFPFSCPECKRAGHVDCGLIDDRDEWILHCAVVHGDTSAALASQTLTSRAKSKDARDSLKAWTQKTVTPARKRKAEDELAPTKRVKIDE